MDVDKSEPDLAALKHVEALEKQLQVVLYGIAQVLDSHSRIALANLSNYAPNAPAALTKALSQAVKAYDGTCDALETELLRALAVLERDDKRAKGLLLEPAAAQPTITTSAPAIASPAGIDDLFGDELFGGDTPVEPNPFKGLETQSGFSLPDMSAPTKAPTPVDFDLAYLLGEELSKEGTSTAPIDLDFDIDALLNP